MTTSIIGRDLAVDLGTAHTVVYARDRGVVWDQPSAVALNRNTGELLAAGHEAQAMAGRTPHPLTVVHPLREGVITDFEAAVALLRAAVAAAHRRRYLAKPRLVVCVPARLSVVEQRAVQEAAHHAGARQVTLLAEPLAAAIGAGLPVHEPAGTLVVSLGAGTTEVALISLGGLVASRSIGVAGASLDRALVSWLAADHSLLVADGTAEALKIALGSAYPGVDEPTAEVRGRHAGTGRPHTVEVSAADVRRALEDPVAAIVAAVRDTLDAAPPELAADVMDRGIALTGGGALLAGLEDRVRHDTGIPTLLAEHPATAAVLGAARCVEELDALAPVLPLERRRPA